ncbi:MAG: hypothetical protein ABJC89_18010 [Acidobacteriota bacterium]
MTFAAVQQIADAVLYEGYVLYPYRASSAKNRVRWQFGVVAPREFAEREGSDPWFAQTECLIVQDGRAVIDLRVRGLQLQARTIEQDQADGRVTGLPSLHDGAREIAEWDEGLERTIDVTGCALDALLETDHIVTTVLAEERSEDSVVAADGRVRRIVRSNEPVEIRVVISASRSGAFIKLRVRVENATPGGGAADRDAALKRALVGTHTLLSVKNGRFLSLIDPPADAVEAAAGCANRHTWPVLAGDTGCCDLLLSSPIILYDYPSIAPESPGGLCDGTEIDEILTLRIMTLTDEEKTEARATDPRAREIVDRADAMNAGDMARLHGTMRACHAPRSFEDDAEWRELLNPAGQPAPEAASIVIAGTLVEKGSRVIIRPTRRADAIDFFMTGRVARVEGVYTDLEGRTHVAVVVDDDPAGDLHAAYGRFLYYGPDEVEPVAEETR